MPKFEKIPVIIDTREQTPWEFDDEMFTTARGTLTTADYSIRGLTDVVGCERKSLGDAVGTFIAGWSRFRRELYRLSAMDYPLIVIECNLEDILAHRYESDASPASVLGRINSIIIDHGINVVCWGSRATSITMVERYLIQLHKKLGGVPQ